MSGKATSSAPPSRARPSICQAISFSVRPGLNEGMTSERMAHMRLAEASMALISSLSFTRRMPSTRSFKGTRRTGGESFLSLLAKS